MPSSCTRNNVNDLHRHRAGGRHQTYRSRQRRQDPTASLIHPLGAPDWRRSALGIIPT